MKSVQDFIKTRNSTYEISQELYQEEQIYINDIRTAYNSIVEKNSTANIKSKEFSATLESLERYQDKIMEISTKNAKNYKKINKKLSNSKKALDSIESAMHNVRDVHQDAEHAIEELNKMLARP